MGNFKEQLQKAIDEQYSVWLSKHEEKLKAFTEHNIKEYGKAFAYCHGRCSDTSFGCMGSVLPSERGFLERWLDENGFSHNETFNSHGARMIVWTL